MKRRLLSLFLIFALISAYVSPVLAETIPAGGSLSDHRDNELIANLEGTAWLMNGPEFSAAAPLKGETYISSAEAAEQIRQAMLRRQETIYLHIAASAREMPDGLRAWFNNDVLDRAWSMELADGPYDGDYLRWSWRHYDWNVDYYGDRYDFVLTFIYLIPAELNDKVDPAVRQLAGDLGLSGLGPYDYIVENVQYGDEALYRVERGAASAEDYQIYSAYGALFNGKAVCQGYSMLLYALCRIRGIPVRIITGSNHAWNIVRFGPWWYNLDSTWDANHPKVWRWFLTGSEQFADASHVREAPFDAASFQQAYPVSRYDYDPRNPYDDVTPNNWFFLQVEQATALGLFEGTGYRTFQPGMEVSRAMVVTVLWRMEGSPLAEASGQFPDVPRTSWYGAAADWAAENGIVEGVDGGLFDPDADANREQLVTILARYARYVGLDTATEGWSATYRDLDQVSSFALESLAWATDAGIIDGYTDHTLAPKDSATRAQYAVILIRFLNYCAQQLNSVSANTDREIAVRSF